MKSPKPISERSPLAYVLTALIPYTRPNLLLAFKPGLFFIGLEKVSRYKQATLRSAYWRAQQQGLIKRQQNIIELTMKGRQKIAPYVAETIRGGGQLMIIFDIPESQKSKRQQLRAILKRWQFSHIQKSVWMTNKDYLQELKELIRELDLNDYVELYECANRSPK